MSQKTEGELVYKLLADVEIKIFYEEDNIKLHKNVREMNDDLMALAVIEEMLYMARFMHRVIGTDDIDKRLEIKEQERERNNTITGIIAKTVNDQCKTELLKESSKLIEERFQLFSEVFERLEG